MPYTLPSPAQLQVIVNDIRMRGTETLKKKGTKKKESKARTDSLKIEPERNVEQTL